MRKIIISAMVLLTVGSCKKETTNQPATSQTQNAVSAKFEVQVTSNYKYPTFRLFNGNTNIKTINDMGTTGFITVSPYKYSYTATSSGNYGFYCFFYKGIGDSTIYMTDGERAWINLVVKKDGIEILNKTDRDTTKSQHAGIEFHFNL